MTVTNRIPLISGDEQDALTPARHWYNWRAGVRKAIKRQYNKRFRRLVRKELSKGGRIEYV